MHSHNRTLIAKLGFADSDKKSPRHDLACQYVIEPEQLATLARLAWPQYSSPAPSGDEALAWYGAAMLLQCRICADGSVKRIGSLISDSVDVEAWARLDDVVSLCRKAQKSPLKYGPRSWCAPVAKSGRLETPIQKGIGQYTTTVGFVDAHATVMRHSYERLEISQARFNESEVQFGGEPERVAAKLCIEVKIGPVSAAEILRQIRFYAEYFHVDRVESPKWIAVTDFGLDADGVRMLRSHGVVHVRLGRGFEQYLEQREHGQADGAGDSPVL